VVDPARLNPAASKRMGSPPEALQQHQSRNRHHEHRGTSTNRGINRRPTAVTASECQSAQNRAFWRNSQSVLSEREKEEGREREKGGKGKRAGIRKVGIFISISLFNKRKLVTMAART